MGQKTQRESVVDEGKRSVAKLQENRRVADGPGEWATSITVVRSGGNGEQLTQMGPLVGPLAFRGLAKPVFLLVKRSGCHPCSG